MTSEKIIQDASQNKEMKNYSLLDMHLYLVIKQILVMYFMNHYKRFSKNPDELGFQKFDMILDTYTNGCEMEKDKKSRR